MTTKDAPYPVLDIFPDEEVEMKILLLCLVWYLFSVVHGNGDGSRDVHFYILLGMYLLLDRQCPW